MRAWRVLTSKLRSVTKRTRDDDEFAAEIDSLIEMHAADHRRAGLAPDEADRRARATSAACRGSNQSCRTRDTPRAASAASPRSPRQRC
jgi:hypothetical protein